MCVSIAFKFKIKYIFFFLLKKLVFDKIMIFFLLIGITFYNFISTLGRILKNNSTTNWISTTLKSGSHYDCTNVIRYMRWKSLTNNNSNGGELWTIKNVCD